MPRRIRIDYEDDGNNGSAWRWWPLVLGILGILATLGTAWGWF